MTKFIIQNIYSVIFYQEIIKYDFMDTYIW